MKLIGTDRLGEWLASFRSYVRDYVLENTGLKVLALLITAVLWLSVASQPVTDITLQNVTIEIHPPDNPELKVAKYDAVSARVTLHGPRDAIDPLRPDDIAVYADLTGIEPGVRVIPLKVDTKHLPPNVQPRDVQPKTIRVTVERVVTKEVLVKPRFDGEPLAGHEIAGWQVIPARVFIAGTASQVSGINEVSTETVSVGGRATSFTEFVAIDIGDPNVTIRGEGDHKVLLTVNIGDVQKTRILEGVAVTLTGAPPGHYITPRTVSIEVSGPIPSVEALKPDDFVVTVPYTLGAGMVKDLASMTTLKSFADTIKIKSVTPDAVRIR